MPLTVTLRRVAGADAAEAAFLAEAVERLRAAVNHPEFLPRVRAASYRQSEFLHADGSRSTLSHDEIVALVVGGQERDTAPDGALDLEVEIADFPAPSAERPGVVGEAAPGRQPIRTARWFIDDCRGRGDRTALAQHLMHEWLHVAGLIHFPDNSARDDPPYVIAGIVGDLLATDPQAAAA